MTSTSTQIVRRYLAVWTIENFVNSSRNYSPIISPAVGHDGDRWYLRLERCQTASAVDHIDYCQEFVKLKLTPLSQIGCDHISISMNILSTDGQPQQRQEIFDIQPQHVCEFRVVFEVFNNSIGADGSISIQIEFLYVKPTSNQPSSRYRAETCRSLASVLGWLKSFDEFGDVTLMTTSGEQIRIVRQSTNVINVSYNPQAVQSYCGQAVILDCNGFAIASLIALIYANTCGDQPQLVQLNVDENLKDLVARMCQNPHFSTQHAAMRSFAVSMSSFLLSPHGYAPWEHLYQLIPDCFTLKDLFDGVVDYYRVVPTQPQNPTEI